MDSHRRVYSLPKSNHTWRIVHRPGAMAKTSVSTTRILECIAKCTTGRFCLSNYGIYFELKKDAETFKLMYNLTIEQ